MPNFELIGVEAVIAGVAAFQRDATLVNRLLNDMNRSTQDLGRQSVTSLGALENASAGALSAMVAFGAGAVTAAAAVSGAAVTIAASFEQNILRAAAPLRATAQQVDELGAAVIRVANNSRLSLGDIAEANSELARSGISLQAIEGGVLDATVKLSEASGGQLGLAQAAKLVSEGMLAWGLSARQVTDVTATLTAVANSSSVGFGDLQSILRQTAPIAAGLNIPIQDLGAAIGIVGKAGVSGFISGSALKDVLVQLADPSKRALQEMKAFGVSLEDANHQVVPLREVIARLNAAFGDEAIASGKVTAATRAQALALLFGTRGIEAGIALARGGTAEFDKFQQAIRNTNPATLADRMRESLIPQLDRLRNILDGLIVQFGTPLERALTSGVEHFNALLSAIDPRVPKAFGDALLAAFSGTGVSEAGQELVTVLGPRLGGVFRDMLNVVAAVRTALTQELIPAFTILVRSVLGGVGGAEQLSGALRSISSTVTSAGQSIARVVVTFANFITQIRQSQATAQLLEVALKALAALPLIAFVALFGRLVLSLGVLGVQVAAISLAFAVLSDVVVRIGATWDGTLAGMVRAVEALPPSLQVLLAAVTAVAAVIAVQFVIGAIGTAIAQVQVLSLQVQVLALQVGSVVGPIAAAAAGLAVMAVQAGLAAAQFVFLAVSAVGRAFLSLLTFNTTALAGAIASIPRLIVHVIALGIQFGILAVQAIPAATAALITFATSAVTAAIGAIGALIAAIAPFLIGIALIGGAVALTYIAFRDNFLGIRDVANTVIRFVTDRITEFLNTIRQIPFVNQVIGAATDAFNNLQAIAVPAVQGVGAAVVDYVGKVLTGFPAVDAQIAQQIADYQALEAQIDRTARVSNILAEQQKNTVDLVAQVNAGLERDKLAGAGGISVPTASIGFPTIPEAPKIESASDKMKVLVAQFERLLSVLPGDTKALAQFLAQLETETPGRLNGMVDALLSARGQLEAISTSHARILVLEQAEAQVQAQINAVQAQQNELQLQREQATIGIQQQINVLTVQRLQIEQQLLPIENAIRDIDEQIARLQRTNFDLTGQILRIEQQELPTKQAIAELDRQISIASRDSVKNIVDEARLNAQAVPLRQRIVDIDTQINRLSESRVSLLQRQQEILQQAAVRNLTRQLDATNSQLDAAWKTLNVPQILALEAQKDQLTTTITTAQDQLTAIQDQQQSTRDTAELASIQLQLQKQDLLDLLNPLDDQITLLKNQDELYKANQDVIVAALTQQKAALQEILDPLDKQLADLKNIQDTQAAASAIAINALDEQKARLEDLAQPLKDRLQDINDQIGALQGQLSIINATYDVYKARLDENALSLKIELANLQAEHTEETNRFNDLVLGFASSVAASGAFTLSEAFQVSQRLGFWGTEIGKLADVATAFGGVQAAADAVTTAINNIPKDVTVNIHVKSDPLPSYQLGGVVPGPVGRPQLAVVHGGEHFLGVGSTTPSFATTAATRNTAANQIINNYSYEVNATYAEQQSRANIGMDLRALIASTQH